jgi:hypothetical protein
MTLRFVLQNNLHKLIQRTSIADGGGIEKPPPGN